MERKIIQSLIKKVVKIITYDYDLAVIQFFAKKYNKAHVWLLNLFPYRFQSFAPDEKLKDRTSKKYLKQLRHLMKNKRVTNIAVTGDLGVGKSTLIRNYERKHKPFRYPWQKFVYLSVNDLKIEELDTAPNRLEQAQEKLRQELEVRLLKQLLVVCEKKDIAGCHYQPVPERKSPVIPFIFTAAAVLLAAWGLGFLDNLAYWEYELWLMILVLVLAAIVVWFAARQLHIHYKTPSFSLRFGSEQNGGSADAAPDTDAELLDKYLMDIVYVMETVYEKSGGVLVIEDLDRYGSEICVPILEKFREINILINQRLRSKMKKPFRFLYVLRDDIFAELSEDEPSTVPPSKFFDGLLTIVPQLGYANSVDFLKKKWKAYSFEEDFLRAISTYVYDYRQIRAIENEYHIFRSVAKKNCKGLNITNTAIMAFCVYRHFYPAEYYDIRKNSEHELVKYLMEKELYRIQTNLEHSRVFEFDFSGPIRVITNKKEYNLFDPVKPELPPEEKKKKLFPFIEFNVLVCMFPGNEIIKLIEVFEKIDRYLFNKKDIFTILMGKLSNVSLNDGIITIANQMLLRKKYTEILELLNNNQLQTDEFKLIFATYLALLIHSIDKKDVRQMVLNTQEMFWKNCQNKNKIRFALCYSMALANSTNKIATADEILKTAGRIQKLLNEYKTSEIAQNYAAALVNATTELHDVGSIFDLADQIQELLDEYKTEKIALCFAEILVNATVHIYNADRGGETAEHIEKLLEKLLADYPTAEIAYQCAIAFFNISIMIHEPEKQLDINNRFHRLLTDYPTREIALQYAMTLYMETAGMDTANEIFDTADRYCIDVLFNPALWDPLMKSFYERIIENAEEKLPTNPIQRAPLEARLNEHKEYLEQLNAAHPSP